MGEPDPPGTYRDTGGSGRGEKTVPEDVVGALLRFVRGNEEFSRPLACFSFSAVFLFQKRKNAIKPADDGIKKFDYTKIADTVS